MDRHPARHEDTVFIGIVLGFVQDLRLQLDSKRKAMDMLAEAYGIGELEEAPKKKVRRSRKPKRKCDVELSEKEIRALEELAAKGELLSRSDSGTNSGTSPRRKRRNTRNTEDSGEKSAPSAFTD